MPESSSVSAILAEQPDDVLEALREQLEKRIEEARAAITHAESELRVLDHAMSTKTRQGTRRTTKKAEADRERERGGRFVGIPRATILSVAESIAYPITPARVVEAFAQRGEVVNTEQIRVALNRIANDGNLSKVGPSVFAVPGSLSTKIATTGDFEDTDGDGPA